MNEMQFQNTLPDGLSSHNESPPADASEARCHCAGKTKYPLKKMIKLASDGIISFSTKPLKIVGGLGIITILISLIILIYSLISYFTGHSAQAGWTSLIVTVTLLSGVQLLSLWIISEYIGRIYDDTKKRPQYIIDKKINIEK